MVNSGTYDLTTVLRDRQNSTFDNFLQIYQTPQEAQAMYHCEALNALEGPVQNPTGADLTIALGIIFCFTYGVD